MSVWSMERSANRPNLYIKINGKRPDSRVAFVGWAFQGMSHGSYPDFQSSLFPTRFFFPAGFFWPPF